MDFSSSLLNWKPTGFFKHTLSNRGKDFTFEFVKTHLIRQEDMRGLHLHAVLKQDSVCERTYSTNDFNSSVIWRRDRGGSGGELEQPSELHQRENQRLSGSANLRWWCKKLLRCGKHSVLLEECRGRFDIGVVVSVYMNQWLHGVLIISQQLCACFLPSRYLFSFM